MATNSIEYADQGIVLTIAGPGFGKTRRFHQAVTRWNERTQQQSGYWPAVVVRGSERCDDKRLESIIKTLSSRLHDPDTACALFIDECERISQTTLMSLFDLVLPQMCGDSLLYLSGRCMPDIALFRWQLSHPIIVLQEPELLRQGQGCWPMAIALQQQNWHQATTDMQLHQYLQQEWWQQLAPAQQQRLSTLALFPELSEQLWAQLEPEAPPLSQWWQDCRYIFPSDDPDSYSWLSEARQFVQIVAPVSWEKKTALLAKASDYWLRHGAFELLIDTAYDDHEQWLTRPENIVPLVVALVFSRRFHQARYVIEQIENASQQPEQQQMVAVLSQMLALFTVDDQLRADTAIPLEQMKSQGEVIHALALLLGAYQFFYRGQLDEAARKAREALLFMSQRQQTYLASLSEMLLIACDQYRGYTPQAAQQLIQAFNNKRENPQDPGWQNYAAGMLILHYERNDLHNARKLCEQVMPYINQACSTEVIIHFYLYYARILQLSGDDEKSFDYLIRLQRFLSLGSYPRYQGKLAAERMRQAICRHDTKSIKYLCDKFNIDVLDEAEVSLILDVRDYLSQARAMMWLYERRFQDVVTLLTPLRDELLKLDYQVRALVAEAQIIVAYWHMGKTVRARSLMQQAVNFYGWLLFNRTLFDEAPLLAPILAQLIERGELEAPAFYLSLYRELIFPDKAPVDNDVRSKLQQLTAKEREVLMLLSQGLSNQEIALQLEITAATTKWHLKNIYRKLSLESRAAAVAMVHTLKPQLSLLQQPR